MRQTIHLQASGKNHADMQTSIHNAVIKYFGVEDEETLKNAEVAVTQESEEKYTAVIHIRMR
jgi:hypothetical protein